MPPTDPFVASARYALDESVAALRAAIEGLDANALNWKPAGDDTNSLAVLATHVMHSTRSWLCVAVGAPLPPRDRDSEFRAEAGDPKDLLAFLDQVADDARRVLSEAGHVDWTATRDTHARTSGENRAPASWSLLHALSHLQEHVGQAQLTRQLWDKRAGASA
jgi:hypothetical protein